jgi:hypothetical protein
MQRRTIALRYCILAAQEVRAEVGFKDERSTFMSYIQRFHLSITKNLMLSREMNCRLETWFNIPNLGKSPCCRHDGYHNKIRQKQQQDSRGNVEKGKLYQHYQWHYENHHRTTFTRNQIPSMTVDCT